MILTAICREEGDRIISIIGACELLDLGPHSFAQGDDVTDALERGYFKALTMMVLLDPDHPEE